LYDMLAFTVGCHYSQSCNKYETSCEVCPQLNKPDFFDLARWAWAKKEKYWHCENLTVVCPSHWLASCVAHSALFRGVDVRIIPSGINEVLFSPSDAVTARNKFSLPKDKKLALFVATSGFENLRKGGPMFKQALLKLPEYMQELPEIVMLGAKSIPEDITRKYVVHIPKPASEKELADLYVACDLLLAPSQEENLALTVLEAMACETPCVAFNIGGMPDVIEHQVNGYLAQPFDVDDLAQGIDWFFSNSEYKTVSKKARETIVSGYTLNAEAEQYEALFIEKYQGVDKEGKNEDKL